MLLIAAAACLFAAQPVSAQTVPEAPRFYVPPMLEGFEYEFGLGDVLEIQVWGRPDLTGQVMVGSSGRIQLPLIGEIRAAGRTPDQLGRDLTDRYQLLDSSITEVLVSVAQYNSRSVTVLGEVRNAGTYGFQRIPDLWSVILTAGGPTASADIAGVQIVREDPATGVSSSILVDLSGGIASVSTASLPPLEALDKVVVPSIDEAPLGEGRFHVLGAVGSPGVYRINLAADVVQALAVSGGPTSDANLAKIYLTRSTAHGPVTYRLDVEEFLTRGDRTGNMELRPGDTLLVPERSSFLGALATGLGRLAPFASLIVTIMLASR